MLRMPFFAMVLLPFLATAQEMGKPFVKNYNPKEYRAHVQNWCAIQDERGVLYFGNSDGLLEYDGVSWKLITTPTRDIVRSLAKDSTGRIYVGGADQIGYLAPSASNGMQFAPLTLLVPKHQRRFLDVWETHVVGNHVYFRTDNFIFRYSDSRIVSWHSTELLGQSFVCGRKFFVQKQGVGLFYIDGDEMVPAPNSDLFRNQPIQLAYSLNADTAILGPTARGFMYYFPFIKQPSECFTLLPSAASTVIQKYSLASRMQRLDSLLFISTAGDGCIIMSPKGEIIQRLDQRKGLPTDRLHSLFFDRQNNLWISTNNGISKVDVASPISFWDTKDGLDGNVESLIRYNGQLYIGTHQGVFFIQDSKIHKLKGVNSACWSFLSLNEPLGNASKLLVGASNGIHEVNGASSNLIYPTPTYVYHIQESRFRKNTIYACMADGVRVFSTDKGALKLFGKISGFVENIRSLYEENDSTIWLGTFRNGAIKLVYKGGLILEPKVKYYKVEQGLASNKNVLMFEHEGQMIFGSDRGVSKYCSAADSMLPDSSLGARYTTGQLDVFNFFRANNGNVWISGLNNKRSEIGFYQKESNGKKRWVWQPFAQIPEMMVLAFMVEPDGTAWIGGSEGLFKYNPNVSYSNATTFSTQIRRVTLGNHSAIFNGDYIDLNNNLQQAQGTDAVPRIKFESNSLTFNFASTSFVNEQESLYSFILEGNDRHWSAWQKLPMKEYTNLLEGSYIFKVKAKDILGVESPVAEYAFVILPPWYRTYWAIISYVLLSAVFVWLVVQFNRKRLVEENLYLESVVRERTSDLAEVNASLEEHQAELETRQEEIMAQAEMLEQTNKELEKLSLVASETDNGVMIMDTETNFEWVNDGFVRMYNVDILALRSEKGASLIEASQNAHIREYVKQCKETRQTIVYQSHTTLRSGKSIWVQTTLTPIFSPLGELQKLIAIDSDITKLKEAEFEISKRNQQIVAQNEELERHRSNLESLVQQRTLELEKAKDRAEESDRLKTAFLNNMSHEIRTPMNAIIGFSNLLSNDQIDKVEINEITKLIEINSNSLLRLIEDIIDLSTITTGQLKLNPKPCDLNKLMLEIFEKFSARAQQKASAPIDFRFVPSVVGSEFFIEIDSHRVTQLLSNLIDNALKYTERGSVEYGYSMEGNDKLVFFVADTGIGISPQQQAQIFNQFSKAEQDNTKLYRGAGIGLAICKGIVDVMGGEISVTSVLGKGTTFRFTIPFEKVLDSVLSDIEGNAIKKNLDWSPYCILVAEDEDSNYRYLELLLAPTKVKLAWAKNGAEAIELFNAHKPNIILMDIKMPVMDGIEATRLIRIQNTSVPIIALSAHTNQLTARELNEKGISEYITKPINPEKLLVTINQCLKL